MATGSPLPGNGVPLVTVAVPVLNQGSFLDSALVSIFQQEAALEIFVADGGSTDETTAILANWEYHLAGWRSRSDGGQAAAVNECIGRGTAPFVCWLNGDDRLLPGAVHHLVQALQRNPDAPAAFGKVLNERDGQLRPVHVEPFDERRLAVHCIISQPGTLIRRPAWERVGGLREDLHMAMDYDLWWRLYREFGPLVFVDEYVAVNRDHPHTKTNLNRRLHYREAMGVVKRYNGRVPLKWWIAQPYAVWYRAARGWYQRRRSTGS